MNNKKAIILAAGDGTRMKSTKPKPLCEVLFKPMINWVIDAVNMAEISDIAVIVTDQNTYIKDILPENIKTYEQKEKLGTGHAVRSAIDFINEDLDSDVLILCGDAPFVDEKTISNSLNFHRENDNAVTVISANIENPFGYGRIIRKDNILCCITEEKEATAEEKLITEVNSGVYWAKAKFLSKALFEITNKNAKKEYYLTDIIAIAKKANLRADAYKSKNADSVLGANNRKDLALLNEIARQKVIDKLYDEGVNIPFPQNVIVSADAKIGADTTIMPNSIILGNTTIGTGNIIGEGTKIIDSKIGNNNHILSSLIENSIINDGCHVGPYTHLRPNSILKNNVKLGNFVEIKSSQIGDYTSVAHLTYLGDSVLGDYVNVGCGVVTANYDGKNKFQTTIGDSAFIGCNTNFIPPVNVGKGAIIAAGSTIDKDIGDFDLAIARAKQENKVGWAKENGKYKKGL